MAFDDWFRKDSGSKDNIFKYWWRTTIPGFVTNLVSRWKNRGYKFGDIVSSALGLRYDPSASNSNDVGSTLNNVTGTAAAQNWQTSEREASQLYNTGERMAAQQFTHDENQIARQWQEQMSNSAIQRQMADARAAGVNPYYLFGAGSASGAGVPVASGSSGSAAGGNSPTAPGSGNSAAAVSGIFNSFTHLLSALAKIAK